MDFYQEETSTSVDPEIKAHITNLVSALGGPDLTDPFKTYKLGDDALACLRDLKHWLKGYDERLDRWDIARAISETRLGNFDLLEILSLWEEKHQDRNYSNKNLDRIALACLELLVPLTWPLELNKLTSTINHYKHAPHLELARARYKKSILNHPKKLVLKAVIRLAIPSLRLSKLDRTARDDGIIKLVLFFIRNILSIEPDLNDKTNLSTEWESFGDDISRSTTITAFHQQKVLDFLITLSAGMGHNFEVQDTVVLESIFYLLHNISVDDIFKDPAKPISSTRHSGSLSDLLAIEKGIRRDIQRHAPSRHTRFGTMISMDILDKGRLSISGQAALHSTEDTLEKLDQSKKWRKRIDRMNEYGGKWNKSISLNDSSKTIIHKFVGTFIDGCFNYLFTDIRKLIEQDNERLLEIHKMHFLYLVSWFLQAERGRKIENNGKVADFGIIGGVLNQRAFIVVSKLMRESFEMGEFQNEDVCFSSILCFKQILLTINDMERGTSEENREIADNMKSRLFYEEQTLNMISLIPRTAYKKNVAYIKECIELVHVVLKMLETFSKQHTVHFVRTRRKQKKAKGNGGADGADGGSITDGIADGDGDIIDNDENINEESKRVTHERKFEFAKFESKLINEATIETYKKYLQNYKELSDKEIKWALSYLHRSFVKREARTLFYSLDFLKILQDMTSTSSSGLPLNSNIRKEVERFLCYFMSKLITALERTPSLYVELMFNKMAENLFYFDHGYEKPKATKSAARVAVWIFKPGFDLDNERKIAIVIATLLDEDKGKVIEWLTQRIVEVINKRREDEGTTMNEILAIEDEHIKWVNKDGKLRLLLELLGFTVEDKNCIIPGYVSLQELETAEKLLKRYLFTPVKLDEGMVAADYLRRKRANESVTGEESVSEDDVEGDPELNGFIANDESDDENDDFMKKFSDPRFNALPEDERLAKAITAEKDKERRKLFKKDSKKEKAQKERVKKKRDKEDKRVEKEQEKLKKIKSSAFVHDSDDESDEERDKEFFESERKLREMLGKVNSGEIVASQLNVNVSQPVDLVNTNGVNSTDSGSESDQSKPRSQSISQSDSESDLESELEPQVKPKFAPTKSDADSESESQSSSTDESRKRPLPRPLLNQFSSKRRAIVIDDEDEEI